MTEFAIRRATADDAAAIARIYNLGSAAQPAANLVTWQVDADDRREWLASLEEQGYPVFVATVAAQPGTVDDAPAEAATAGDPAGTAAADGAPTAGADPAGTAAAAPGLRPALQRLLALLPTSSLSCQPFTTAR